MKLQIRLLLVIFFISSGTFAQSYIGYSVDNYSGIHGVIINPADVVDSKFRTDINLFSASAFAGSDYFAINIEDLLESSDGFEFEEDMERHPENDNQFFLNIDVLGPSFMFNLNSKSSLAVTTRVRGFMNLNNMNGTLFENVEEGFDEENDFDFELKDFNGTIHAWGEIGVTYGRIVMNNNSNFLKAGVTLKYLYGAGAVFVNTPSLSGQYNAITDDLSTSGSLTYGTSNDFNGDDIDFNEGSSGFGADLGFSYEYRPESSIEENTDAIVHSAYKFKLGISVTDLGNINYSDSEITSYDLNDTGNTENFENEDLEEWLDQNYNFTERIAESKIGLPTAVHVLADYKVRNRLFIAVQGSLSLIGKEKEQANRILNTVTAVPRYESRWFGFSLPVGIRQHDGLTIGSGFRFGPLSVGSGSLISNYLFDSVKTTDVYVGLKIPIYRK